MSDSNRLLSTGIPCDAQDLYRDQRPHTDKHSKGLITSFGFKRRTGPDKNEHTMNQNKMKDSDCMNRQESIDMRKDAQHSAVNRFGFRYHPTHTRLTATDQSDYSNNNNNNDNLMKNRGKPTTKSSKVVNTNTVGDSNRNKIIKRATTQYSQLPKPQSVFYNDTKIAKTLMNTTRKIVGNYHEDCQKFKSRNSSCFNSSTETSPVSYDNDECANTAKIPKMPKRKGAICETKLTPLDDSHKQQSSDKLFIKPSALKTYLKTKSSNKHNTSPEEWPNGGGEAMADDVSFSVLALEKCAQTKPSSLQIPTINNQIKPTIHAKLKNSNIALTLEDPKFAAIAAASSDSSFLLDDETSPVESLISTSESEESLKNNKKHQISSSDSKDVDEKSASSPGTPTNTSSFSDGKEDFLIDDEIADQPALVFEHTDVIGKQMKESDLQQMTPKLKRRTPLGLDFSSLSLKNKNSFSSAENLSSCDSLTSDDLMIDYDSNCSSGVEDNDAKLSSSNRISKLDKRINKKERTVLIGNYLTETTTIRPSEKQRTSALKTLCKSSQASPNKNVANLPHTRDTSTTKNDEISSECDIKREEITNIKTMLVQLKHLLNESEAQICLDNYANLRDHSNNLRSLPGLSQNDIDDFKMELIEMKRQILFLQGQLEDKEMNVKQLKDEMAKISTSKHITAQFMNFAAQSAKMQYDESTCNAATQTDRVRPASATQSPVDDNAQSLGRFQAVNGNTSIHYMSSVKRARPEDMISYNRNMRSNAFGQQ